MKIEWSSGINAFYRKRFVVMAMQLTAKACGVEASHVLAPNKRNAPVAFARQLAMYLCHVVGDMSLRDVAVEFARDRTTVSHACHAIEDRRECPIFDRQVEHLERDLRRRMKSMIEDAVIPDIETKAFRLAV
jgi:hypothetical protein